MKFYLYIVCVMIITYYDSKYNFKSILLYAFFVGSFFFWNNKEDYSNKQFLKVNKNLTIQIFLFTLSFSFFFSILPLLIYKDDTINKIGNYTNYGVLKVLLLSPLLEELIFRGSLLPFLIKKVSIKKAVVLSSLGFTIVHYLSNSNLLAVFILAVFLGILYVKTKNIFVCFIAHSLSNIITLIVFPFFLTLLKFKENSHYFMLITCILSFVVMILSLIKTNQEKNV